MRRIRLIITLFLAGLVLASCGESKRKTNRANLSENIIQGDDGNIILDLEDAYQLHDNDIPGRNTAEWLFHANKEGRYEVWLNSLTKDTMDLRFEAPVIVTCGGTRLEIRPVGNEIVLDASDSQDPYFRADSRLGSVMISTPGDYELQVISEKILPTARERGLPWQTDHTKLLRIVLKPMLQ
jgi:hypothetical protein